jgi:signal peptidase II
MAGITYYLYKMISKRAHSGFLFCLALILGGAIGNVIDSIFYGVFLNNAPLESPSPWFHGQVIDMLYFPLFDFYWPEWVPIKGGQYFEFFSPVFNIADSSIFIGVVIILFSQKRFFKEELGDSSVHVTTIEQSEITMISLDESHHKPSDQDADSENEKASRAAGE